MSFQSSASQFDGTITVLERGLSFRTNRMSLFIPWARSGTTQAQPLDFGSSVWEDMDPGEESQQHLRSLQETADEFIKDALEQTIGWLRKMKAFADAMVLFRSENGDAPTGWDPTADHDNLPKRLVDVIEARAQDLGKLSPELVTGDQKAETRKFLKRKLRPLVNIAIAHPRDVLDSLTDTHWREFLEVTYGVQIYDWPIDAAKVRRLFR